MDTNESIPGPFVVINGDNWREMAGIGASTKTLEHEKTEATESDSNVCLITMYRVDKGCPLADKGEKKPQIL